MNYKKALKEFSKQELIELILKCKDHGIKRIIIDSFSAKIMKLLDEMSGNISNSDWDKMNKEYKRLEKIMDEDNYDWETL